MPGSRFRTPTRAPESLPAAPPTPPTAAPSQATPAWSAAGRTHERRLRRGSSSIRHFFIGTDRTRVFCAQARVAPSGGRERRRPEPLHHLLLPIDTCGAGAATRRATHGSDLGSHAVHSSAGARAAACLLDPNKACDPLEALQVVRAHLIGMHFYLKLLFEKHHQTDHGERIEDAARNKRRCLGQLVGIHVRQELPENVRLDGRLYRIRDDVRSYSPSHAAMM